MFKLDKRLKAIIDNIPDNSIIADIGTDHGKIAVGAIVKNKARFSIATDISHKSLNKAKILASTYTIQDKISFREGDGLDILDSNEADTLIISGMGAKEIIAIIDRSVIVFDTYIFVPHQDTPMLRKYLSNCLYKITKDYIVECRGKYYNIIVAKKCNKEVRLNYQQLMLGQSSSSNNDYINYINNEFVKLKRLLEKMPKEDNKHRELTKYYDLLEKERNE